MAGGGIGQESVQPLRVDASQFVAPLQLGVQQNAVAAMTDAFRKGQISANDIAERYGVLAKSKEKFQIQGIDEFLNPAAIQTRQNQQAALNTDAILKSSPEYVAMQEATTQMLFNKANEGDYGAKQEVARKLGFFDGFDPAAGWTPEQKARTDAAYADAVGFNDYREQAKTFLAGVKPRTDDVKTLKQVRNDATGKMENVEVVRPRNPKELYSTDKYGRKLDDAEIQAAERAVSVTANQWKNSGRAASPFGEVPGKVATPVTPAATGGKKITENKVVIDADGTRTESERVEEELPAVETKVTPVDEPKASEKQINAQAAAARMPEANAAFAKLEAEHYDPTKLRAKDALGWAWPALSPDDTKRFVAATNSWIQGILRMESGAAISPKEQAWYVDAFFPKVLDPPELVANKKRFRDDYTRTLVAISNAGGASTPESLLVAERLREQAGTNATASATSTQAGQPTTTVLDSGEEIIDRGGGGIMVRKPTASTNAVPTITPKYTTPGLKKVVF